MKKILLTISIFFICSTAHATTWYACSGGGNWNGASVWTSILADEVGCTASTGNPVAGDTAILNSSSGNITITAAAAAAVITETGYTGTLAFGTQTLTVTGLCTILGAMTSTSGTLSCAGGVTLGGTPTGTFPTLTIAGSSTFTPAGFTWPGNVSLGAFTLTLAANTIVTGNFTMTGSGTVLSGAFNLSIGGNLVQGGNNTVTTSGGIPTIILNGSGTQTWTGSAAHSLRTNLTINSSGTVVISGGVAYGAGTFLYQGGTVTTTSSTLGLDTAPTLTTDTGSAHITFNNITMESNNTTVTLGSNLTATGTFTGFGTVVFSGAFNMSVANFNYASANASATFTFPASQTLTVTNSVTITGSSTTFPMNLASGTASSPFYFNYTGPLSSEFVSVAGFADTYAGAQTIYDFNAATLTRVSGIKAISAANVHPKPINYFTGV